MTGKRPREEAEDALRLSEERLQLAVDIAQMGTFEIDLRTDAVRVNDVGREIYGWSAETPLTFSFVQSHFHPEDRDEVMRRVQAALDPEGSGEFAVEQRIFRTTGEERWIRVRGRALFQDTAEGRRAVRCFGTYVDVTDRTRVEQALRESEEHFRDLADNISQLAWITDRDGNVLWYNRRWFEYTGTTLEQVQGVGWQAVQHPDHLERVVTKFRRCLEAGTPWEDVFPLRGANGEYRWFLSRAMPIRREDGQVVRWLGTNTDITAQREAEQALRDREERLAELNTALAAARDEALAASSAKSTFLANMSHELRTPLNAIIGYAEMLREDVGHGFIEPAELLRDLERISSSGRHLLDLINQVLDFSKIEANRIELADEEVDLARLLNESVEAVAPQMSARGNKAIVAACETERVRGDFLKLKQVLINLLSNAAKFTERGEVRVECRVEQAEPGEMAGAARTLLIAVSDTGIGIAPDQLPFLFESFRQLDTSPTRRHGGTGLGLAISRKLVEVMGGRIEVHSVPGEGSRFTIHLPVRSAA